MYIKTNWIAGETEVSAENLNKIEEGIYKNSLEINSLIEDIEGSNISTDSSSGYAKDIEILGNTIQDASNLADIRSVGDKVEGQELYEIPVLSVGKNLFDKDKIVYNKWIDSTDNIGIGTGSSNTRNYLDYTKVVGGCDLKVSGVNITAFFVYSDIGVYLPSDFNYASNTITLPQNSKFIRFTFDSTKDFSNVQIEYGTQATPYEPYVEDKLTILSPTPLEKVGDVADRIIEKDGVWGVEKWTTVKQIPNNLYWMADPYDSETTNSFWCNATGFGAIGRKRNEKSLYHKKLNSITRDEFEFSDTIGISTITNGAGFFIKTPKNVTVDTVNNYIAENGYEIICTNNTPQFIPLPHSQQVKLRTFASKTNISFGCEIEGTIKAQVPKSLGATVNTHTEQISNLNKELDRVKKLEESTVSTVETESDFTTVEATNNGYFEDVKLEGRTLVNLFDYSTPFNTHWKDITISQGFKPNTKYTFIIQSSGDASSLMLGVLNTSGNWSCLKEPYDVGSSIFMLTTDSNPTNTIRMGTLSPSGVVVTYNKIIILEGDHTQNPPSYFEGLKSVGQSTSEDGADEIVVSSVNPIGNLFNGELERGFININTGIVNTGSGYQEYIRTKDYMRINNNFIHFKFNKDTNYHSESRIMQYDSNKNFLRFSYVNSIDNITFLDDVKYIKFLIKTTSNPSKLTELNLSVGYTLSDLDIPHQSDKKRLLYYNNETQAWEKPILRKWDSIEKHANGKYYYHQRSGEIVLNGSENWNNAVNNGDYIRFGLHISNKALGVTNILCDKIVTLDSVATDSIRGSSGSGTIFVNILKSKLSTPDVQGFKQWLQSNNVTVVYQLAEEKVYECTNIDLITYANETNYVVNSGAIVPRTTLKVHNNISNVVSLLQKKVSLLESNVKASQEVQDMMILETDMRMLDIELALMEFMPMKLNLGGSDMLRSTTYFNFIKNHIVNETYSKEYLENVMNKYLATNRLTQEEYDELYKLLYPPVYDIELPIEY